MTLPSRIELTCVLGAMLVLGGCGGQPDAAKGNQPSSGAAPQVLVPVGNSPAPAPPPDFAPPPPSGGQAPPAVVADSLANFRETDPKTGQQSGDVETMQKIVDGYAFGKDGLGGNPPLKDLSDLVKNGYLKQLPAAPKGKKWAYDAEHAKVSLVNQ